MLPRKHGISSASFYKWKARYGELDVSDAHRLKTLEEENARLKKLLAEAMLDNAILKDVPQKCMTCPARTRIGFVLTTAVRLNVSGLSRVDRCCGQAKMRSARRVLR